MELWDGYRKDGSMAGCDLVRDEPIPEGLFHLVSEVLVQHADGSYLLMQRDFDKKGYLCITDCDKTAVTLQEGETIAYRWLDRKEFLEFVDSEEYIQAHRSRLAPYLDKIQ